MGGTVHGLVNKRWARVASATNGNQGPMFKSLAAFFDHLCTVGGGSYMTRIASKGGSGDLQAVTNDSQSFGVWRMNTSALRPGGGSSLGAVYIFLAQTGSLYMTQVDFALQRFGNGTAQNCVAISIAFREDGGNPWNGGTGNVGTDNHGTPVWTAGSSVVHVFPRSNNPGGTHVTNKNNMIAFTGDAGQGFYNIDTAYGYVHGIADADNFAIVYSGYDAVRNVDDPMQYSFFSFGLGDVLPGLTADPYLCYCIADWVLPLDENNGYGDTAGTSTNNGGIKKIGSTVGTLSIESYFPGLDTSRQPNPYVAGGAKYDESGLILMAEDGVLGRGSEPGGNDFLRLVYGVPNEGYDAVNERAAFGPIASASSRVTIPWPSSVGTVPGGTRSSNGTAF